MKSSRFKNKFIKLITRAMPIALLAAIDLTSCSNRFASLSPHSNFANLNSLGGNGAPGESREITFPSDADMSAIGWLDVTKNGASVVTGAQPELGCPNAIPNHSDAAATTMTTQAIQCRLNNLGIASNPGVLYFPAGTYYINDQLSLTPGYWKHNPDSTYTYINFGGGDRSGWTNQTHLIGRNPETTKLVWSGSCATNPQIADPAHITKYNTMFYVMGESPLSVERLTFDGQNCAGTGLEMTSAPNNMSGVQLRELTFQNLKEVGVVGDRAPLTFDEIRSGDGSGMVSEVTISRVSFKHIGYAGILINAANALDYWIRESLFEDCGIGVTNTISGIWAVPGTPGLPGLKWGGDGAGNFDISNSIFKNSRGADIFTGNGARAGIRNNYSIGSQGPFLGGTFLFTEFFVQGNTVVAGPGIVPITLNSGFNSVMLLQNKIMTTGNTPALSAWTIQYGGYPNQLAGASPIIGNLFNISYSNVTSIGNQYSAAQPYSSYSGDGSQTPDSRPPKYTLSTAPGWAAIPTLEPLQCAMGKNTTTMLDQRTTCTPYSAIDAYQDPSYNLVSFDDQVGVSLVASEPVLPPIRPEVVRDYLIPHLNPANSAQAGNENAMAIQNALTTLGSHQSVCLINDYYCPQRWGIVFIPSGHWMISKTVQVPGGQQLQIIGSGESLLAWY